MREQVKHAKLVIMKVSKLYSQLPLNFQNTIQNLSPQVRDEFLSLWNERNTGRSVSPAFPFKAEYLDTKSGTLHNVEFPEGLQYFAAPSIGLDGELLRYAGHSMYGTGETSYLWNVYTNFSAISAPLVAINGNSHALADMSKEVEFYETFQKSEYFGDPTFLFTDYLRSWVVRIPVISAYQVSSGFAYEIQFTGSIDQTRAKTLQLIVKSGNSEYFSFPIVGRYLNKHSLFHYGQKEDDMQNTIAGILGEIESFNISYEKLTSIPMNRQKAVSWFLKNWVPTLPKTRRKGWNEALFQTKSENLKGRRAGIVRELKELFELIPMKNGQGATAQTFFSIMFNFVATRNNENLATLLRDSEYSKFCNNLRDFMDEITK